MSLPKVLAEVFLGRRPRPERLEVSLWNGQDEVKDARYERQDASPLFWDTEGLDANVSVRFGPFAGPVQFDVALLTDEKGVVERYFLSPDSDDGPVRLVGGMFQDVEIVIPYA